MKVLNNIDLSNNEIKNNSPLSLTGGGTGSDSLGQEIGLVTYNNNGNSLEILDVWSKGFLYSEGNGRSTPTWKDIPIVEYDGNDFTLLNNWSFYEDSPSTFRGLRIGNLMWVSGILMIGSTTRSTNVLELPKSIRLSTSFQYITCTPINNSYQDTVILRDGQVLYYLRTDNNYDLPEVVLGRALAINGVLFVTDRYN